MLKIIFGFLLNIIVLLLITSLLTWLYGVFGNSPFFIFFIILISSWSYSNQSRQIQSLNERIMKLEGFDR